MTIPANEHLLDWLRDAHAMEQQSETMLKALADRLEHYPELKSKIASHIDETRWQRDQLELCLSRLGGSPSVLKDMTGKFMAYVESLGGMASSDEVIKGAMGIQVFEHLEIASYRILIAAAGQLGDAQTLDTCRRILEQEQALADWLLEHLAPLTQTFLARSEQPEVDAKN